MYGKVVVITGGAGTIGIACAKKVLKNGGNVVLVDNSQKGLDNAQNILNSDSVSSLKIDITESNAAKNILNFCLLSFGGADILISNAGSAVQGMTDELGSKEFRDSFELNFFAHYELSKCFLHFSKNQKIMVKYSLISRNSQSIQGLILVRMASQNFQLLDL